MKYTARFAHLLAAPRYDVGDVLMHGVMIGYMGNSGQSSGPHLHLDLVEGEPTNRYTLADIEEGEPAAAPLRQLLYFVDNDLFGMDYRITTSYADPDYFHVYKKIHYGFDLVPYDPKKESRKYPIFWNRSNSGKVIKVMFDAAGYGHCISIAYDT